MIDVSRLGDQVTAAGLTLIAEARWPRDEADDPPPPVAGFVASSFSPLVAEVSGRCLTAAGRTVVPVPADWQPGADDDRVAVVIASATGDEQTAHAVADAVDTGARMSPLLFFQAVPNAVAGHVAARWGLTGPVVCLSPASPDIDDVLSAGLSAAGLLIDDGDAEQALVIVVDQASDPGERALAILVGRDQLGTHHREGEGP